MLVKMKTGLLIFLAIYFSLTPAFFVFAQITPSSLEEVEQQQADLQAQLKDIERQINQYEQELKTIQGQKNTLQNKINQLKKQQSSLNLQIKSTTLQINSLTKEIFQTQSSIDKNITKSQALKQLLAQILRTINAQDQTPLLYTFFNKEHFSEIFVELDNYSRLSKDLTNLLEQIKKVNADLGKEKASLADQQDEAENLLSIQTLQRQNLNDSVSQKNELLQETKGQESNYQESLADSKKRAQEIRSRLYQLLGVAEKITFGQAVQIATWASDQTRVRAAFLLAILTQESNLGKNVGTCNRPGDPPSKSWRVVMKPERDQEPFLEITKELGLDPDITPVSCPMKDSKGKQMGWGGAMGPAQFIPSTWMGYKNKITAITGKNSNPWDIRDAFLAAALKLAADGATSQKGEWAAAMRYFSGSTNPKYSFYGDNVVAQAAKYQNDLNELNK
ncbi:MAG: Peptidase M23 [Candidatus Magasanikbacteria bacterium GW2011_GWC2_40_17]|uniref:Peptidase M23 n=1 Tax=Candidatus Magasanikbacteria bacterium GW2011_GWA2_42_32 TaxID=1619039 RepID=A0A0G1A7C1_9BACT|nr:MAG: Peptidase M23 [Candidatus Magasanikbacteria bacterium GW2011_GWC2_40_17]KKS56947.1 MAG: Peptidase M23 [Candidatus Magasanikbacteria bacterium GW2011_GWA2_42_32]OGH85485.1 MAG: hypothetical protein A2294_03060 [Candidatus Magasanikbacteria bacterium RIFOXYB2_FULL_38_10]